MLLAFVFPAILYGLYRLLDFFLIPRPLPGIPRLSTTRYFWGDTKELFQNLSSTNQFHLYFENTVKSFEGGWFQFFYAFSLNTPLIVIQDPVAIDKILASNAEGGFERATATKEVLATILPYGSISLNTDKMWKHRRRLFGSSMSSSALQAVTPDIVKNIKLLFRLWDLKHSLVSSSSASLDASLSLTQNDCFEVALDLNFTAQDIISTIAFGQGYNMLSDTIEEVEKEGRRSDGSFPRKNNELADASRVFFQALPATSLFPATAMAFHRLTSSSYRASERLLHGFLDDCIEQGRKRVRAGEAGRTLLDAVLEKELKEEQSGLGLAKNAELRDELCTFLIAGEETTATTMSWMLRYLSQNPQVQHRIHEEVVKALPPTFERDLVYNDMFLESTPYLDAVLHETLRVASPVVAMYRETTKPVEIKGHIIPKGIHVMCLIGEYGRTTKSQVVGGDEKFVTWEDDAREFRPERWLDAEGKFDIKAGPSLPFSTGQRGCFGVKLATLELKLFLALLAQTFFLASVPDELADPEEKKVAEMGVTRKPSEGVWVRVRRWEK